MKEVFEDAQVQHCKMVEHVEHPVLGQLRQLSSPNKLDSLAGGSVRMPPPGLGQHSVEILSECGYCASEIDHLIEQRIVLAS